MGFHAKFALANREAIENEIKRLIGLLDAEDAPFEDLEPETDYCLAGDDGPGFFHRGGQSGWGAESDRIARTPARYGVDQSLGPVNGREVEREYRLALQAERRR